MKICPKCNSLHEKSGKFCSRSCANSRGKRTQAFKDRVKSKLAKPRIEVLCFECGTILHVLPSVFNSRKNKFCSRSCTARHLAKIRSITGLSDFTKRKISDTRKRMFSNGELNVTGGTAKWIEYKDIKIQGSYELRTCFVLDSWLERSWIDSWEYTNDRITYTNSSDQEATYLLDFKVLKNSKVFYIETKGFLRENDVLKWKMCEELNIRLFVWFLDDIIKAEKISSFDEFTEFMGL